MRTALSVLFVSALGLGCSENAVVGGRLDAFADITVTDATAPDKPGARDVTTDEAAPAPDVVADVIADVIDATDGPVPCTSDAMCAGDPGGAVCDTTTGRCVECVAARDTCSPDRHCDDASHRCVAGCRSDEGCASASADAGAPSRLRCDTTTRACVECVTSAHCAAGTLCVGNVCIAGCDPSQACPAGQTCCNGGCVDVQANTSHCGACGSACVVPHSAPACRNGQCAVGGCTAPFADCDMSAANGCETDTRVSNAHCGRCANACARGSSCVASACRIDPGCADGTREGFTDTARFPAIAACQGTFMGYIDEASARSICAPGWHVCRGGDAVVRAVRSADARAFAGCFAYDAAQDCNYCSATCRGIVGDPRATCSVADGDRDADMAGVGSGCSDYGAATSTCLVDGRIDSATNTFGCRYDPRLAGVVYCLD